MSENKFHKSVGTLLKETRESKNIPLEEASRATHIHGNILKKIESDDFSSLGTIYVKGFLKIYADYLGLDKKDVVERFTNTLPQGPSRSRVSQGVIIPGASQTPQGRAVSKFGVAIFSWLKKIDPRVVVIAALCVFVVWGFRAVVRAVVNRRAHTPSAETRPSMGQRAVQAKKAVEEPKAKARSVASQKTVAAPQTPSAAQKVVLVVRAKAKTWLQVKVDGKTLFQNVLARGAAESWTADKKIEMVIGNAGAIELELNGRILEKIGRPGQTLKHVVVTRDGLTVNK
ncbi:MAG: DUF4115 domain-containing protein [Candidatus Omnitrophica bacterium]|nr:DUF4115 domain-containing protein [Candidatus Omnitrophota bacterium]MDD5574381.1 DUF4115 domain-containing protein [Candidatus Omnitrophota bacterium]